MDAGSQVKRASALHLGGEIIKTAPPVAIVFEHLLRFLVSVVAVHGMALFLLMFYPTSRGLMQ